MKGSLNQRDRSDATIKHEYDVIFGLQPVDPSLLIKAMKPDGKVIASGILLERKLSVEEKLISSGVNIDHHIIDGDWVTLIASNCVH